MPSLDRGVLARSLGRVLLVALALTGLTASTAGAAESALTASGTTAVVENVSDGGDATAAMPAAEPAADTGTVIAEDPAASPSAPADADPAAAPAPAPAPAPVAADPGTAGAAPPAEPSKANRRSDDRRRQRRQDRADERGQAGSAGTDSGAPAPTGQGGAAADSKSADAGSAAPDSRTADADTAAAVGGASAELDSTGGADQESTVVEPVITASPGMTGIEPATAVVGPPPDAGGQPTAPVRSAATTPAPPPSTDAARSILFPPVARTGAVAAPARLASQPAAASSLAGLWVTAADGLLRSHAAAPAPDRGSAAHPTGAPKSHPAKPARVARADGGRAPSSPFAPPGRTLQAAGSGSSSGGTGPELWCVLILGLAVAAAQELRRRRIRLVAPRPAALTFLLERPG